MKMLKSKFVLDERSKRKLEETSTGVLGLFYVVCTIEMITKIIITHEYFSVLGELIILLLVTFTFLLVQKLDKNSSPMLPRKNNGEELSAEKTRKAKLKRFLVYAKESTLFSVVVTIISVAMDYFIKKQNITWNFEFFTNQLANTILFTIVFFIITAILKERSIKKYNKWNEKLEE
jgi:cell shape-determining protein MreD